MLKNKFDIDFSDHRFVQKIIVATSVYCYFGKLDTWLEWGDVQLPSDQNIP